MLREIEPPFVFCGWGFARGVEENVVVVEEKVACGVVGAGILGELAEELDVLVGGGGGF